MQETMLQLGLEARSRSEIIKSASPPLVTRSASSLAMREHLLEPIRLDVTAISGER